MTSERDKIAAIVNDLEVFIQEKEAKNQYVSPMDFEDPFYVVAREIEQGIVKHRKAQGTELVA